MSTRTPVHDRTERPPSRSMGIPGRRLRGSPLRVGFRGPDPAQPVTPRIPHGGDTGRSNSEWSPKIVSGPRFERDGTWRRGLPTPRRIETRGWEEVSASGWSFGIGAVPSAHWEGPRAQTEPSPPPSGGGQRLREMRSAARFRGVSGISWKQSLRIGIRGPTTRRHRNDPN